MRLIGRGGYRNAYFLLVFGLFMLYIIKTTRLNNDYKSDKYSRDTKDSDIENDKLPENYVS